MKNNETRFAKKNKIKKKRKGNVNSSNQRIKHIKNAKRKDSLDSFTNDNHQDGIFDSQFSRDDFLKLTKKWKEKNLEI